MCTQTTEHGSSGRSAWRCSGWNTRAGSTYPRRRRSTCGRQEELAIWFGEQASFNRQVRAVIRKSRSVTDQLQCRSQTLEMPKIGMIQASFAGVFEEFVHRREQHAGSLHVQSQIEIDLVVQEMNVAVAEHAEECAGGVEVLGVNDSLTDRKARARFARDVVSAAWDNMVQNP